MPTISIVIRTLNEARHLPELLSAIEAQRVPATSRETIVVDSGSSDGTIELARERGCRVVHIPRDEFTFGRSLNIGCREAQGSYLVLVSGHCIPASDQWLSQLVRPLEQGSIAYSYGRQLGSSASRYSERQLFRKYYPADSRIPQDDFFCNNANAALLKSVWDRFPFDEDLTGLEDMDLARRLRQAALQIAYVADAPVYHLHDESWHRVRMRYEREAVALQRIMPEVHFTFGDFCRYFFSALALDCGQALGDRVLLDKFGEIFLFRLMQFWGSYRGNHQHRKVSREMKERYFFPK